MGLFRVDLAKELTEEEFALARNLLLYFGTNARGEEALKANGLYLRLGMNTVFSRSELKEVIDRLLLAGRFLNTKYDDSGNTVEALEIDKQQAIIDLLNKISRL